MSRRNRKEQRVVTQMHHVRDMPQRAKQAQKQRRAARALPQKVVDAAYAEYQQPGESARSVGERHWQAWGCKSPNTAAAMLQRRFKESGYPVRGRGRPETSGISHSRAPNRKARIRRSAEVRAAYAAECAAQIAQAREDPLLGELVREQEKDARTGHRVPHRPWLVPLDLTFRNEEDESDYGDRGAVVFAKRRGDFLCEAVWVEPLIAWIDALRERCAA